MDELVRTYNHFKSFELLAALVRESRDAEHAADIQCYYQEVVSFYHWKERIDKASSAGNLKLHLGSGNQLIQGWINCDIMIHPSLMFLFLPRGLRRFSGESTSYVYCSHLWEHIDYPSAASLLAAECHRILVPGGVLRICVPGIEQIIQAYVRDDEAFFKEQERHHPDWCRTKMDHLMFAVQQNGEHKYGYDFETMEALLKDAGFSRVINSGFNQSEFPDLRVDYRQMQDPSGNDLSLWVDAVKQ